MISSLNDTYHETDHKSFTSNVAGIRCFDALLLSSLCSLIWKTSWYKTKKFSLPKNGKFKKELFAKKAKAGFWKAGFLAKTGGVPSLVQSLICCTVAWTQIHKYCLRQNKTKLALWYSWITMVEDSTHNNDIHKHFNSDTYIVQPRQSSVGRQHFSIVIVIQYHS